MKVTKIGNIKFEDYVNSDPFHEDEEHVKIAKDYVMKNQNKIEKAGFKRIQFDTIAGYAHRRVGQGRFVPVTTMHSMRFLKR